MPFGIPPQIIPLLKPLQGNEAGGGGDGGQGWGEREDGSLILKMDVYEFYWTCILPWTFFF